MHLVYIFYLAEGEALNELTNITSLSEDISEEGSGSEQSDNGLVLILEETKERKEKEMEKVVILLEI